MRYRYALADRRGEASALRHLTWVVGMAERSSSSRWDIDVRLRRRQVRDPWRMAKWHSVGVRCDAR